jgi:xanthine dehydrogenase YagT iron-sulfur-binding subunit
VKDDKREQRRNEPMISRRSFIKGAGAVAAAAGLIPARADADEAAQEEGVAQRIGPGAEPIELKINGETRLVTLEPRVTLLRALR